MGLDLVEFAMAVEAEFDVRIPDEEAARLLTLGEVHAWLVAHFGRGTNDPGTAWRRILELAEAQFGVEAASMTPQTRMLDLAPWG